jgi:hypothetical protein
MTARAVACVLMFVAIGATGAQAQGELRIEGGAARIRQFGRTPLDASVLAALWRGSDQNFAGLLSGSFTYAGDSATAAQGIAALAWRPGPKSIFESEGGITGAAFGAYSLGRGGNVSGYARERLVLAGGGFWAGGGLGGTQRDGLTSGASSLDAGGSVRSNDFEGSFSIVRLRTDDEPLMTASAIQLSRPAAAYDFEDAVVAVHFEHGPARLDASETWRGGLRATMADQRAFYWTAAYAISPRYSVAVAGGRQLADPVHGTPDTQTLSAVLRVVLLPLHLTVDAIGTSAAQATLIPQESGSVLVVRVAAPDSSSVEIAGSFSDWQPVPVRRTETGWEARIALPRGRYRLGVRINGGKWRAPGNLGKVLDEFGGESGLVVVP